MPPPTTSAARLNHALVEIDHHLEANVRRARLVQDRVAALRKALDEGSALVDVLRAESPPSTVELITANMKALETAGSELRAALAIALRDEGIVMTEIADLFGVTRQRISALLRQKAAVQGGYTP